MFAFRDSRGAVEVRFTDRALDLKELPGVAGPLEELAAALGTEVSGIVTMHQVHGRDVAVIEGGPPARPPEVDGVVTARSGWVLASRGADCVPVLLADPESGVVGAAHAGRKGLVAGVVPRTVEVMRERGASHLVAWVGPHACGRCYEVPAEMRDDVAAVVPEAYAETSWGTPAVDLGSGVAAQLVADEVEVVTVDRCTIEDGSLFSHRRDGATAGRQAGLIWLRS